MWDNYLQKISKSRLLTKHKRELILYDHFSKTLSYCLRFIPPSANTFSLAHFQIGMLWILIVLMGIALVDIKMPPHCSSAIDIRISSNSTIAILALPFLPHTLVILNLEVFPHFRSWCHWFSGMLFLINFILSFSSFLLSFITLDHILISPCHPHPPTLYFQFKFLPQTLLRLRGHIARLKRLCCGLGHLVIGEGSATSSGVWPLGVGDLGAPETNQMTNSRWSSWEASARRELQMQWASEGGTTFGEWQRLAP